MHHSHATPIVTSLPSASYLTWGSVLETSRLRLCGQTENPLASISGTRGRLGRNPHGLPRRRVEPRISLAPADRTESVARLRRSSCSSGLSLAGREMMRAPAANLKGVWLAGVSLTDDLVVSSRKGCNATVRNTLPRRF